MILRGKNMSDTEIFGFNREGNEYKEAEIKNAWRGAMAVWESLEEKYLPQYRPSHTPSFITDEILVSYLQYKPTRMRDFSNEGGMKEVWELANDARLEDYEKVVLATTFDNYIVKKEDFPELVSAFREFGGNNSLAEQADIIEKMYGDENCIAVGFNQTSVNHTCWANSEGIDEESQRYIPYNIIKGTRHIDLFRALIGE